MTFSEELKQKMISYMREKYDLDITPEQADEYLRSLADLYFAFYETKKRENTKS